MATTTGNVESVETAEAVTTEETVETNEAVIAEETAEAVTTEKKKEKKEKDATTEEDKEKHAQYAYLTKLLNINHELTPDEAIKYAQIIEHTGFTPELLLKIVKDPSCEENLFKDHNGKEQPMLDKKELLIISKALWAKISKDITWYTEADRSPKVRASINVYGVTLSDLKQGPKALFEKVVDPKTGKVDEETVDAIIKWFEKICLK
jgi:hypothetical protein